MNYKAIYEAAVHNNPEALKPYHLVIDESAEGKIAWSALSEAAFQNNGPAMEVLLEQGANINYAIRGAAFAGNEALVKRFLAKGADIGTAIRYAVKGGQLALARQLQTPIVPLYYAFTGMIEAEIKEAEWPVKTFKDTLAKVLNTVKSLMLGYFDADEISAFNEFFLKKSAHVSSPERFLESLLFKDYYEATFLNMAELEALKHSQLGDKPKVEACLNGTTDPCLKLRLMKQSIRGYARSAHWQYVEELFNLPTFEEGSPIDKALHANAMLGAIEGGHTALVLHLSLRKQQTLIPMAPAVLGAHGPLISVLASFKRTITKIIHFPQHGLNKFQASFLYWRGPLKKEVDLANIEPSAHTTNHYSSFFFCFMSAYNSLLITKKYELGMMDPPNKQDPGLLFVLSICKLKYHMGTKQQYALSFELWKEILRFLMPGIVRDSEFDQLTFLMMKSRLLAQLSCYEKKAMGLNKTMTQRFFQEISQAENKESFQTALAHQDTLLQSGSFQNDSEQATKPLEDGFTKIIGFWQERLNKTKEPRAITKKDASIEAPCKSENMTTGFKAFGALKL